MPDDRYGRNPSGLPDPTRTKVLMCYHNIYDSWSWLGGHADGDRERLGQELDFTSVRISRRPESFEKELAALRVGLPELPKVIKAQTRVRSRSNAECRRLAKIAGNLLADCLKQEDQ